LGRTVLSKSLKQLLVEKYGSKCCIYSEKFDDRLLQIDRRIPYEISGDSGEQILEQYMLLSPSANRAKSWTCQHCENWNRKALSFCLKCFWAYPENYEHIAGTQCRMVQIIFTGNEIEDYNKLIGLSGEKTIQQVIKEILHEKLK
jgi:hypothetical protein